MVLLHTPEVDTSFTLPDVTLEDGHGNAHALYENMGEKGMVLAFISNHCPYVQCIVGKLVQEADALREIGIGFVAVAANDIARYPQDGPAAMAQLAEQKSFSFPYLFDATQALATECGAVCTPDFFGFNAAGKLCYRGRLDDSAMSYTQDRPRDLFIAMQEVADTQAAPAIQHSSQGCSIKWKAA